MTHAHTERVLESGWGGASGMGCLDSGVGVVDSGLAEDLVGWLADE